jgi:mannose-6-phosphate isomerase
MITELVGNAFYPLMFEPILKEMVWGGTLLSKKFGRCAKYDKIGESWDVSCHKNGESIVANGELYGFPLRDIIKKYQREILGTSFDSTVEFPILLKLIHANDALSVQVHPPDSYAQSHEGEPFGKTEMWYILEAGADAELVYGLKKGTDKASFCKYMEQNKLDECLNRLKVRSGDAVFIPAGLVHAIGKDILLCEIQQSSDLTYRVYDWNRTGIDGNPRKLHIDQALDVIDFNLIHPVSPIPGLNIVEPGCVRTFLVCCKYFAVEKIDINTYVTENTDGERFHTLTAIRGLGEITFESGSLSFKAGDSLLIPAALGKYEIRGECGVIKAYVPESVEHTISLLMSEGFTTQQIINSVMGLK